MVYIPRYLFQKANLIKSSYRVIHVDMFVTDNFSARKGLNGAQDHAIGIFRVPTTKPDNYYSLFLSHLNDHLI